MPHFIIKYAPLKSVRRVKVIAGTAVSKKAAQRNLLRRRIRAILGPISATRGKSYLVIAKPGAAALSFKELEGEIREILSP